MLCLPMVVTSHHRVLAWPRRSHHTTCAMFKFPREILISPLRFHPLPPPDDLICPQYSHLPLRLYNLPSMARGTHGVFITCSVLISPQWRHLLMMLRWFFLELPNILISTITSSPDDICISPPCFPLTTMHPIDVLFTKGQSHVPTAVPPTRRSHFPTMLSSPQDTLITSSFNLLTMPSSPHDVLFSPQCSHLHIMCFATKLCEQNKCNSSFWYKHIKLLQSTLWLSLENLFYLIYGEKLGPSAQPGMPRNVFAGSGLVSI